MFECVLIVIDAAQTLLRYSIHLLDSWRQARMNSLRSSAEVVSRTSSLARPLAADECAAVTRFAVFPVPMRRVCLACLMNSSLRWQQVSAPHLLCHSRVPDFSSCPAMKDEAAQAPWEWQGTILYYSELTSDVLSLGITLLHYCHIWYLHGFAFQVRDHSPGLASSRSAAAAWRLQATVN